MGLSSFHGIIVGRKNHSQLQSLKRTEMCRKLTMIVLAALLTATLGAGLASQKKDPKNNNGGKEDPLKKAVQQYEERIDRLEDFIRKASEEQKFLAETKLHKRMAEKREELQKRLANLERELASVHGANRKVKEELATTRADLDKANAQLVSTRNRFHRTESEIRDLRKRRVTEAEGLGRRLRDVQNQAKKSAAMVKDLRAAANATERAAANETRDLGRKNTALEAALSKSNDLLAAARHTARQAESKRSDRSASIASVQRQLKSMTRKYNDLRRRRAKTPAVATTPEVRDGTGIHIHNQGGTVVMHVHGISAPDMAAIARKKAPAKRRATARSAARTRAAKKKRAEKNKKKKAQPKKRINI